MEDKSVKSAAAMRYAEDVRSIRRRKLLEVLPDNASYWLELISDVAYVQSPACLSHRVRPFTG